MEYKHVNPVGQIHPTHPGPLEIYDNTTQHAATRMLKIHKDAIHNFHETIDIQKALAKKIVQMIDATYIHTICDRKTNTITENIQKVLAHLIQRYGIVEADTLSNREQKVRELAYNLLDPLVTVYTEVKDLEQLAIATWNPY